MIPELASNAIVGIILPPNNSPKFDLSDWEMGGIALENPQEGANVKPWKATYNPVTSDITLESAGDPPMVVLNKPGIQWLSFCFDQNMRYVFTWTLANGKGYLYWYDPQQEAYSELLLGDGIVTPHLTLDYKLIKNYAGNDVILTYLQQGSLILRVQRERFITEHVLATGVGLTKRIRNFGMSTKSRLQWEVQ